MAHNHHTDRWVKLRWLAAHRKLWEGWIQYPRDERAYGIIKAMREADLISKSTYWEDVNLNNLIQDARALMRKQNHERRK